MTQAAPTPDPETATPTVPSVDVVVPTIRDLDFLERWRGILDPYRIIVVQDGDPSRTVAVPDGFRVEVYDWNDLEERLGERRWVISKRDSACRCFGFLVADADVVFTLDDDCVPAHTPEGEVVDPVAQHLANLGSSAHPEFFNTLYDQEFVRGYPFGYREGTRTVISHGLWMNVPDFDAPTQMVRPGWRNGKYVDVVQTVPAGVLYPMCGMNLAFDRRRIGPAMYFGLMGDGQPWGRYDDMWAGWCSKVVADHLGWGVKSGKPYISHEKASDWRSNFRKEFNGILWQEEIVPFFREMELPAEAETAEDAYRAVARAVREGLTHLDDNYFSRLADGMEEWLTLWEEASTP